MAVCSFYEDHTCYFQSSDLSPIFFFPNLPFLPITPSSPGEVGYTSRPRGLYLSIHCDSGGLKWRGSGYDLQLEWFSISHPCLHRPDGGSEAPSVAPTSPHVLQNFYFVSCCFFYFKIHWYFFACMGKSKLNNNDTLKYRDISKNS